MSYLAKSLEALGLGLIAIGFLIKFPELMNPRIFFAGIGVFLLGWLIERFLMK